jgi:hypothetical protein
MQQQMQQLCSKSPPLSTHTLRDERSEVNARPQRAAQRQLCQRVHGHDCAAVDRHQQGVGAAKVEVPGMLLKGHSL